MSNSLELSSDTLFHFTELKYIINILKEGFFRPKYCLEDINLILPSPDEPTEELEWAIPMVCFCDVPSSQSKTHRKIYGNYGIGLSKEWGMRKENKISPVLYAYQESAITHSLLWMWIEGEELLNREQDDADHTPAFHDHLHGVYCFTKLYEGKRWITEDKRYSNEKFRFYDEREWRFVPTRENRFEYVIPKKDFLDMLEQDDANYELDSVTGELPVLNFEPSDIECIIVTEEREIDLIVKELEQNTNKYSPDDIELLSSKVEPIPVE